MTFLFVIILIFSIITIFKPEIAWYLSTGWKLRNAEPSDLALTMNRVSGVVLSIISVIVIISNISSSAVANSWPKDFVSQLSVETIDTMTIHFDQPIPKDKIENIVEIIKNVNFTKSESQAMYGCSTSIEIVFTYGERETIYCWGEDFWIEPGGRNYRYNFKSPELKKLIDEIE